MKGFLGLSGAFLIVTTATSLASETPLPALSPAQVQQRIQAVAQSGARACVAIHSPIRQSWGSGVLIDADKGLIATAAHVVAGSGNTVQLTFHGSALRIEASVLRIDRERDLAYVRVPASLIPSSAEAASLARQGCGATTEWCVAFGHAAGYQADRTAPLRVGRIAAPGQGENVISTCRLVPGDSGGPLFSLDGKLLGIHSRIDAQSPYATHVLLTAP